MVDDYKSFFLMLTWAERKNRMLRFVIPTMRPFRTHNYRNMLHTKEQVQQNKVLEDWGIEVGMGLDTRAILTIELDE